MENLAIWILFLMGLLEPRSPYQSTFPSTAEAFARVATEHPLFAGKDAAARTAALLVSVAWFESRFDPSAEGDPGKDKRPHSFCALQIHESNFAFLGTTRAEVLGSIGACARAGGRMMAESFRRCSGRPVEDRMNQYATGGGECVDSAKGRHRVLKAQWIFANYPPPR